MNPSPKNSKKNTELLDFQRHQFAFTATIRNPDGFQTPDGIEERRMAVYRELVFNNIEDLLANFFPVMKQITPDARWHEIVKDFVANHKSKTPIFMKLAEEFVVFLQSEYEAKPDDPEFLVELAHYEWVEMALDTASEEPEWEKINREGDLVSDAPYLSPLIWSLSYRYPVHRIGPDNMPTEPLATNLLVYRDTADEVQFMEINPVAAHLLNILKTNSQSETKSTGMQLLQQIADEMQHPNPDIVISGGLQIMQEWFNRDILLGTYR
ncbi:HvfC family RiPP maturation protein [Kaarinaea lacus]